MKKHIQLFCLSCLTGFTVLTSQGYATSTKHVTLVNAQALDKELAERVHAFVEQHLHIPIRLLHTDSGDNLLELGRTLKQRMTVEDLCFVVLVAPTNTVMPEPVLLAPDSHWALVNVSIIKPESNDSEIYRRRLNRQIMRAFASLFGIGNSLNPRCVHRYYTSIDELDKAAQNFAPETQGQFLDQASRRGIDILERRTIKWRRRQQRLAE